MRFFDRELTEIPHGYASSSVLPRISVMHEIDEAGAQYWRAYYIGSVHYAASAGPSASAQDAISALEHQILALANELSAITRMSHG